MSIPAAPSGLPPSHVPQNDSGDLAPVTGVLTPPVRKRTGGALKRMLPHVDDLGRCELPEMNAMSKVNPTIAEQIAEAATAFQQERTGHAPKSVSVMVDGDTLVITLHGALSPAEQAMAQSPEGAAKVQEFHRQLFHDASAGLRHEIKRITRVEVRDASVEIEPINGSVVQVLPGGTMVQVFLLAKPLPPEIWNGRGAADFFPKIIRPPTPEPAA